MPFYFDINVCRWSKKRIKNVFIKLTILAIYLKYWHNTKKHSKHRDCVKKIWKNLIFNKNSQYTSNYYRMLNKIVETLIRFGQYN